MKKDRPEFRDEVEHALQEVAQEHGVSLANRIRPIVGTNMEKGRLDHFVASNPPKTASDYVLVVITGYLQWHERVEQIQQEKSTEVWAPLQEQLEKC